MFERVINVTESRERKNVAKKLVFHRDICIFAGQ